MGTSIGPQQGGGGGGGGGTSGIDLSLAGNTSGTLTLLSSGTAILAGGSNITLSQNGQSITISGAAGGAAFSGGISGGNTSGNTGTVSNLFVLAGGNNITLSGSTGAGGMSATISAFNSSQSVQTQNLVDLSLSGNTSGALALVSSGTAILAGGNNITLSQNGQSITISQNDPVLSYFEPAVRGSNTEIVLNANYLFVQPFFVPNNQTIYRMEIQGSWNTLTSTFSVSGFVSSSFASYGVTGQGTTRGTALLFSRQSTGTAAASSNIVTFYSNTYSQAMGLSLTFSSGTTNASSATFTYTTSAAISFLSNIDSVGGTTTGSFGTSVASTVSVTTNAQESTTVSIPCAFANSVLSGARPINIPINTSLSPGEYWLGIINSSATASTQYSAQNVMNLGQSVLQFTAGGVVQTAAIGSTVAFSSSNGANLLGSFNSASTTNTTTTMALTNISVMTQQLWFNMIAQTL